MFGKSRIQDLTILLLSILVIVVINMLAGTFHGQLDLTEEKRFTLTPATKKAINDLDVPVYAQVLMGGEFPAGFRRLQKAAGEMLQDLKSENSLIDFDMVDPFDAPEEDVKRIQEEYRKDGLLPVNIRLPDADEVTEKLVYPYVLFYYGERRAVVSLIESDISGILSEDVLNNSVSLLEYKFVNAISKLSKEKRPYIAFIHGRGELPPNNTAELEKSLRAFYQVHHIEYDSITRIDSIIDLLVIAKPRVPFGDREKFMIDQYVMNGGKVLWLIDALQVVMDSIKGSGNYIPSEYPLNLDDLFFRYGFRINKDLVLDLECSQIPLQVGVMGDRPQYELFSWYYHPTVSPRSQHPIVKNLDRINLFFPSSIDTIKTKSKVKKTLLLESSDYTRLQLSPVRLNFEILRYEPDESKFNKGRRTFGVLLEGEFSSLYKNRVTESMHQILNQLGQSYKEKSKETAMIVLSDGDLAANAYNTQTDETRPLGYNVYERTLYANQLFLLNAIDYLVDDTGILSARSKDVKLRLLDKVRISQEKGKWQLINIVGPLLFVLLFGMIYNFIRRKKYIVRRNA